MDHLLIELIGRFLDICEWRSLGCVAMWSVAVFRSMINHRLSQMRIDPPVDQFLCDVLKEWGGSELMFCHPLHLNSFSCDIINDMFRCRMHMIEYQNPRERHGETNTDHISLTKEMFEKLIGRKNRYGKHRITASINYNKEWGQNPRYYVDTMRGKLIPVPNGTANGIDN